MWVNYGIFYDFLVARITPAFHRLFTFSFQVLQICDILEHNGACNDRSVVILLVFLSSQLLVKKSKVMPVPQCFYLPKS